MARGSSLMISCGFKVGLCVEKQFHRVLARIDHPVNTRTNRDLNGHDPTPS